MSASAVLGKSSRALQDGFRALLSIANVRAEIDNCKFQSTSTVQSFSALMLAFVHGSFMSGRLALVTMC